MRGLSLENDGASLDEVLRIHEYERGRMGQELHDSAGQLLVSLQLSIGNLRRIEKDTGHDDLFDEIGQIISRIDQEIRALAFLHHPAELSERGLVPAVQSLVRGFARRTGIDASFDYFGEESDVGQPVSVALLRVAQEALVNIHRHSHASSAKVVLELRDNRMELTVWDDGVGMPALLAVATGRGIGIDGMRHRMEALGGRFEIKSLRHGTKVFATVPLAA